MIVKVEKKFSFSSRTHRVSSLSMKKSEETDNWHEKSQVKVSCVLVWHYLTFVKLDYLHHRHHVVRSHVWMTNLKLCAWILPPSTKKRVHQLDGKSYLLFGKDIGDEESWEKIDLKHAKTLNLRKRLEMIFVWLSVIFFVLPTTSVDWSRLLHEIEMKTENRIPMNNKKVLEKLFGYFCGE